MLDGLVLFKTKLRAKLALWRSSCAFYEKLTAAVGLFHPPEIQDKFVPLCFGELQGANKQLRQIICRFLVSVLAN